MQQKTPTPATELESRFRQLLETLEPEMRLRSNSATVAKHPAYQEIITMGESAIPLILQRIEHCTPHWFPALHIITGANPAPKEIRGNVGKVKSAWLKWGREQGYIR